MDAAIISIGDELLIGQVNNTNASWISRQLTASGIRVIQVFTIADAKSDIIRTLELAAQTAEIIICTGGLGPTKDDITREALCAYFEAGIKTDANALEDISRIFAARGLEVTALNRKQADVPDNCRVLRNEIGTSPGMWFTKGSCDYFFLPGVPFEMEQMMQLQVIPELKKRSDGIHIIYRTVLTMGMGESFLSERLADWEDAMPQNVTLAWLPEPGIIKLRLTACGARREQLEMLVNEKITELQRLIPELIFGYDDDTLESVIGQLLITKEMTVSTAESCTGGNIAHLITSVPGSSAYFMGAVVAYDNSIKSKLLGVDAAMLQAYGAVSEPVVRQMAEGAKVLFNTDYAVATSGIAGPAGATEGKPVGTTWVAVAGPEKTIALHFLLGDNRGRNIRRASLSALNALRKSILENF